MAQGFPLCVDLKDNNCTIFGGGENTVRRITELRRFGAKVTVISPTLCAALETMSQAGEIRHIPRKYFRGDCTNSQLCIAATDDRTQNIAITAECKAKSIPVNVTDPAEYGNFFFPRVVECSGIVISIIGEESSQVLGKLQEKLQQTVPAFLEEIRS